MNYRRLGSTNLSVSVIGLGTWQFGGEWGVDFDQPAVDAIFDAARETGINLIDTAECYGDHLSERLIGEAISRDRTNWIVATKFGHRFHGHMNRTDERSPSQVRQQLEDSLKALRTDYIDLYQFHSVRDEEFFNEELWKVLAEAKRAGKIRHIGNSISGNIDPIPQAAASPKADVEFLQLVYNRLERKPEQTAFPIAKQLDFGILARVPLASGFLSGKYQPGSHFSPSDFRSSLKPDAIDEKLREVARITREELPPGVPLSQWALAWCLKNPAVTAVIPGCKSPQQVRDNAAACAVSMGNLG